MNVINVFEPVGERPGVAESLAAGGGRAATRIGAPVVHTLRKSGGRPISFSGRHVGQHNGYRLGTALWHELNLYQTDDGRYVSDVRVYSKATGGQDQYYVSISETLDEAVAFFEAFDARADVGATFQIDDPTLSPAELLAHAAALKYSVADAVSQYNAALGAFLKDLNNT